MKNLFALLQLALLLPLSAPAQPGTDPLADGRARSRPPRPIDSIYVEPSEIYERLPGGSFRKARYEDVLVARGYEPYRDKGKWTDDRRITILAARKTYKAGDTVRVIHVFEDRKKGRGIWIMGPKSICGEYVNDSLASDPVPDYGEPWVYYGSPHLVYDGAVPEAPGTDYNFDSAKYVFTKPGLYRIQWRVGGLVSNELAITVE